MPKTVNRLERVNALYKRELASIIERSYDGPGLVSITRVAVAPDLHNAIVSVSCYGGEAVETQVLDFLNKHRATFQHLVSRKVILKYTPILTFHIDHSIEGGDRVLGIMQELAETDPIFANPPKPGAPSEPSEDA